MRLVNALFTALSVVGVSLIADEPKPIDLSIQSRAIEAPVLKYRLLPSEGEKKPGNAVPILLRLPWDQRAWMNEVFPTLQKWVDLPLNASEWEGSEGVLPDRFYREIKRAAFRREASWEYPILEMSSPYMVLLPDVQDLRGWLGRGLAARIRYHLSRGELAEAQEGILVGLANSRHIAQTPFYINQGVANSLQNVMVRLVEELISQPDSPNLYWALTMLPESLLELDRAADFESSIFKLTFPAVNDFDRPRDPDEWSQMAQQMVKFLEEVDELPRQEQSGVDESAKSYVAKVVSQARIDLAALFEISSEEVAKMSDDEAFVRWYSALRIAHDEHLAVIMTLDPMHAGPELKKLQAESQLLKEKTGANVSSNATATYWSAWRLRRKIQMLRVIEAVRDYGVDHDGKFPQSLDEIKEVPIPVDPITNQAFVWKVEADAAMLSVSPMSADLLPQGFPGELVGPMTYRLRMQLPQGR